MLIEMNLSSSLKEHEAECECNHRGSSNGVKRIWLHSAANLKLHYVTLISDRNAKSFTALCELEPYGPNVTLNVLVMSKNVWVKN